MNLYLLPVYLAQAYGSGTYGGGTYGTGNGASSSLTDTGMPILLGGTIGVALIVCAVILLIKARKRK